MSELVGDEIRQFVERAETQIKSNKDGAEDLKEIFAEAKGRGFDTKILRLVIARRAREKAALEEEETILEMYETALGG